MKVFDKKSNEKSRPSNQGTITYAFSIARIQKERLDEENRKTTKVANEMVGGSSSVLNPARKPPVTQLTKEELKQ